MTEELKSEKDTFPIIVVEKLVDDASNIIGNGVISHSNIITILLRFMQTVEKYKDMDGDQKKNLVLYVLNRYIEENVNNDTKATELKLLVNLTLPTLIDTFIAIDRKKIIIKTKNFFKNKFKCCKK